MSERLHELAQRNFRRQLAENSYPGRGVVIGRLEGGDWIQLYWIMGRSANSRNRKLVWSEGELRTEPLDAALVEDPTNIIYEAMLEAPDVFVVSNGDQTRTILNALAHGDRFEDALATREREDDAPNYTPRIAGLLDLRGRTHQLPRAAQPRDPARQRCRCRRDGPGDLPAGAAAAGAWPGAHDVRRRWQPLAAVPRRPAVVTTGWECSGDP